MCGIVGKLLNDSAGRVERGEIEQMLAPISHRGPDGNGVYLDANAGLGHCRLSIIDVGGGAQPMTNEDESVWIVFNGEIYNFQPLREDLLKRGHVFRSHCDTEVIIHLYEEYGVDCLRQLQGMFAFAIWDRKARKLFVARDRVGIKPLYYAQTPGALLFGSELKALLTDPLVSRQTNPNALRRFFTFNYVPGDETLFTSVRKLPPGHFMVVQDGRVSIKQYWDLQFTRERWNRSFDEIVVELHELLAGTVRDHMIADVPVGVLLSGGVDSSAVLSFAVQGTAKKVKAFTIGFGDTNVVDERPYARLVARQFGAEHHELSITAEDFWNFLPDYVWHMEEPVCEPPAVALYYISRLAREHVKVLLSGEGGDEAFAGYPNYPHNLRLERINSALGPAARPLGAVLAATGGLLGNARALKYGTAMGLPLEQFYFSRTTNPASPFNRHANRIFAPEFIAATADGGSGTRFMTSLLQPAHSAGLLDRMLYADTKTWLPDDLLVKADKMTMANSIELRVPLLDHKVLEFAASLPEQYKVRGKETKRALKATFARVLPSEILTRKKAGFPVPYGEWLRGPLYSRVRDVLLSPEGTSRPWLRRSAAETLLAAHKQTGNHAKEIFSLLTAELWHRQFSDQSCPHNVAALA
jgi:asparagine synthase (glutamine-hydrolysing)